MELNTQQFTSNISGEVSKLYNKLSKSGQQSISYQTVNSLCQTISKSYLLLEDVLKYNYRDEEGKAHRESPNNKYEYIKVSPRLKRELFFFITNLLANIPKINIDIMLEKESDITEGDKQIIKETYNSLNREINNLHTLFGLPCFGTRKEIIEESETGVEKNQ